MVRNNTRRLQRVGAHLASLLLLVMASLGNAFLALPAATDEDTKAQVAQGYSTLPLVFEPNLGQTDDSVQFLNRTGSTTTYFTPTETVFVRSYEDTADVLRVSLVGANEAPAVEGLNEQESRSNYFVGNDESKWQTDVPHYEKVQYDEVYPGIDLVYYGNNSQLEHDFVVSPGTNPDQIAFQFEGANDISIDDDGNLVLTQDHGTTVFAKPFTYQETKDTPVDSSYVLAEDNTVKFALADYDTAKELVIDPVVVSYSTYLGGSGSDSGSAFEVHPNGNIFVVGHTSSTNFPTASAFQGSNSGSTDIFLVRMAADGSSLVYATYLGGSGADADAAITVDFAGNAYITGRTTSSNFPTASAYQGSRAGPQDAFVTKINPTGSALIFSTYLGGSGGSGTELGRAIAVDAAGNVYVAGQTNATNFPTASTRVHTAARKMLS